MSELEVTEVILNLCNIVSNKCQHASIILCTFLPNKSFGQLRNISSRSHIYSKAIYSEFSYIELWFAYQSSMSWG